MGGDRFGDRLRWARNQAGLSQAELARRARVTRPTVAMAEGGSEPGVAKAAGFYEVLVRELPGLDSEWFFLGRGSPYAGRVEVQQDQEVKRRKFARLLGAAALLPTTLPLPMLDLERLTAHATLDVALVEGCEQLLDVHGQLRMTLAPAEVLPMAETHLLTLRRRLAESIGPDDLRRRLLRVAGLSAVLAGWTCYRLDRRRDARAYLDWAERLGREIDENDVLVLVLMLRSDLASAVPAGGLEGQPVIAYRLADEALTLAAGPARTVLLLRRAGEHAFAHRETECRRDLDEAVDAAASAGRPLVFDAPGHLPLCAGNCLQMLGRPSEAIDVISPYSGGEDLLSQPVRPIGLAACQAQMGNLDGALELLGKALDLIEMHGLTERARQVAGIRRRHLARWNAESRVHELDERLAAIL